MVVIKSQPAPEGIEKGMDPDVSKHLHKDNENKQVSAVKRHSQSEARVYLSQVEQISHKYSPEVPPKQVVFFLSLNAMVSLFIITAP